MKKSNYLVIVIALALTSCVSSRDALNIKKWEASLSGSQTRVDIEKPYVDALKNARTFEEKLAVFVATCAFFQLHATGMMNELVLSALLSKDQKAAMAKVTPLQLKIIDRKEKGM